MIFSHIKTGILYLLIIDIVYVLGAIAECMLDVDELLIFQAIFEGLEETINELKMQLKEKESIIDSLQDSLHSKSIENENLTKRIK